MTLPPVPFLDLVTPHRELEEELVAVFREALRSAAFIGGPQVESFEREFADYCGDDSTASAWPTAPTPCGSP